MPSVMFWDDIHIGWIIYLILLAAALFVILISAGYIYWNYHSGKPLSPFFWLRLKSWTNRRIALFEIFSLTNSVSLEEARKEIGDGYRLYTPTFVDVPVKKTGKFQRFINFIVRKKDKPSYGVEKVKRTQNLIMPKSVYSVNGVNTILLYDLHPQLHTDILEGVKILIAEGITTLEKFENFIKESVENAEKNLFKNYSYRTFMDLYLSTKQKFYISVTTDNIVNFVSTSTDKNFRESLECKDFNFMMQNKQGGGKTLIYGYLIIGIIVLAIAFKIIYNTLYK